MLKKTIACIAAGIVMVLAWVGISKAISDNKEPVPETDARVIRELQSLGYMDSEPRLDEKVKDELNSLGYF